MICCRECGEEYSDENFLDLEYLSGGPYGYADPEGGFVSLGFNEFRRCARCKASICKKVVYDPDVDPITERNPVPTMRPPPESP